MADKMTQRAKPFARGQEQAEAMLGAQRELLEAYEQASRAWLVRVKSEVDLWAELATKLSATRSLPEALGTYQECVTQHYTPWATAQRKTGAECPRNVKKFCKNSPGRCPTGGRPAAIPEQSGDLAEQPPPNCIHAMSSGDRAQDGDRHGTGACERSEFHRSTVVA